MKIFGILAIAVIAFLMTGSLPLLAADFRTCEDCHFERLNRDRRQFHQHQAFAKNECKACHVRAVPIHQENAEAASMLAHEQRLNWLADSMLPATTHYFLLSADSLRDTLVISQSTQQGLVADEEVPLPPLEALEAVVENDRIPQQFDVRVVEVKRGVFLTVTIAWKTDALAAAEVRYGTAELDQRVDCGGRLGREHQVVLTQLKPNQTYRYQVIARDLSGRESVSEILTFATTRVVPSQSVKRAVAADTSVAEVMVDVRRHGDDYLLEVALDRPRGVIVSSKGQRVEPPRQNPDATGRNNKKDPHVTLSDKKWSAIASCTQCHDEHHATGHPVNVLPPPGMIIPAEYPTLDDGRVTCVSCHDIHGSEQEKLTRKRSKRELCVGCHRNML